MECRVVTDRPGGPVAAQLVIGEVVLFHVRNDLYRDGEINVERLRPLASLAGNQYVRLGETFELDRPWLAACNQVCTRLEQESRRK